MSNNNKFWGARSGAYSGDVPKGHKEPWGFVFRQQQYGSGANNSNKPAKTKLVNVNPKFLRKA